jgi:hypothetical protein
VTGNCNGSGPFKGDWSLMLIALLGLDIMHFVTELYMIRMNFSYANHSIFGEVYKYL